MDVSKDVRNPLHQRREQSQAMQKALLTGVCSICAKQQYVIGFTKKGPVYDHYEADHTDYKE